MFENIQQNRLNVFPAQFEDVRKTIHPNVHYNGILETIITPHLLLCVILLTRMEKFVERSLNLKHSTNSTSPMPIPQASRLVVDSTFHGRKNVMSTKMSVHFAAK